MHAYRCRECTLVRCDVDGSTCAECLGGSNPVASDPQASLRHIFTLGSGWWYGTSPAPTTPQIHIFVPGDFKNNAREAAKFMMGVNWGELGAYGDQHNMKKAVMALGELHRLLKAFGNSP